MRRRIPRRDGEPTGVGATLRNLHLRYALDLICLHSAGGADASEVIDVAHTERIPTLYVHHFANDRLRGVSLRSQLERVDGIAGVCGLDVSSVFAARFRNISDGIDVTFFRRDDARVLGRTFAGPVIFLPARITPSKGQADLIRAAGELKRRGAQFHVVLAGRTDDVGFLNDLKKLIEGEELREHVEFLGHLDRATLRDWHAASSVMAFPTYNHEGLGRVSVEAQAMEVPPIVYDVGGTAEALKDRETGFLVPLGDFNAFVNRIEQLLNDSELRIRMGKSARRFVEERYSLQSLAEKHEKFYLDVLSDSRSSFRKSQLTGARRSF